MFKYILIDFNILANDYVGRLEKIIDKQEDLLKHLDAEFNQQQDYFFLFFQL